MQKKVSAPQINLGLGDLNNVTLEAPTDGDVLTYDTGAWVAAPSGGGVPVIEPDKQVVFGTGTGVTSNESLLYDTTTNTLIVGTPDGPGSISSDAGETLTIEGPAGLILSSTDGAIDILSELYASGLAGNLGDVLTASAPGTPPHWAAASTGASQAFYANASFEYGSFNQIQQIFQYDVLSTASFANVDNESAQIQLIEEGLYKITIIPTINQVNWYGGDTNWVPQVAVYGSVLPNAISSYFSQHRSYAPDENANQEVAYGFYQLDSQGCTFSDTYLYNVYNPTVGDNPEILDISIYVGNYSNNQQNLAGQVNVVIERIASTTGST